MTDKQVQEIKDSLKVQTITMVVWFGVIIGLLFSILIN